MKQRLVLFAALILAIAGCATAYGPESFKGGYEEEWITETEFIVKSRGNGFTAESFVVAMAQLRSAEIAEEKGFPYFWFTPAQARESYYNGTYAGLEFEAKVTLLPQAQTIEIEPQGSLQKTSDVIAKLRPQLTS